MKGKLKIKTPDIQNLTHFSKKHQDTNQES